MAIASGAPTPAKGGPVPTFHVANYQTLCTENSLDDCTTSFELSVNGFPAANCDLKSDATSYVLCGAISPEQAYSGYIEKPAYANESRSLQVKFATEFPGATAQNILGRTIVEHSERTFSFAAYEST